MSVCSAVTVFLMPELKAFIADRLSSGRYANGSEVTRAALRPRGWHQSDLEAARKRPADNMSEGS